MLKTGYQKALVSLTVILLLMGFTPTQGNVDYFRVRSMGDRILLEWKSISEDGLTNYTLERKKDSESSFSEIKEFNPQGDGSLYQFIDMGLYKSGSNSVDYRLKITTRDGVTWLEGSGNYTTTSVRKTWGSIKAMFK